MQGATAAAFDNCLAGHPTYEALGPLEKYGDVLHQLVKSKHSDELFVVQYHRRGWDEHTSQTRFGALVNHKELSSTGHPHIVPFVDAFLTSKYLAVVLQYVDGESFEAFLEKIGGKVIEGLAKFIFQQLAIAVDFCHRSGKILRDIKMSNLLLSFADGQLPIIKLGDFSASKDMFRDGSNHAQVGSALFAAPEVLLNAAGGAYDGKAADIWSCGVLLYISIVGRHPFLRHEDAGLSTDKKMLMILNRTMQSDVDYASVAAAGASAECVQMLQHLLVADPALRFAMRDIQQHAWFKSALPAGAERMNDVFLAKSGAWQLPVAQVAELRQLVLKAALDDGDTTVPFAVDLREPFPKDPEDVLGGVRMAPPSDGASAESTVLAVMSNQGGQPATTFAPTSLRHAGMSGSGAAPAPMAAGEHATRNAEGVDAAQSFNLADAAECIEEQLMRIPTSDLLAAATEDILHQYSLHVGSMPSLIAPRSHSELERGLMVSSSFMRDMSNPAVQALLEGALAAAGPDSEQLIVDAGPFLIDDGGPLPGEIEGSHASPSKRAASWMSLRGSLLQQLRSLKRGDDVSMLDVVGAMSQGSFWAQLCRDPSKSNQA